MKNKYQEALNFLDWHCEVKHTKQQALLKELVDKETPMKPRYRPSGNIKCGCGLQMYEEQQDWYRYCASCGQKIDWSDERE